MNQRKKISIFIILFAVILGGITLTSTEAYSKARSKSRTTQSRSKSKKSRSRTSRSSKSKKNASTSKKRQRSKSNYSAPKPEVAQNDSLTLGFNASMLKLLPAEINNSSLRVNSVKLDRNSKSANISLNENFTYISVNSDYISKLQNCAVRALPDSLKDYRVNLTVSGHPLTYYITTIDKLPEKYRKNPPFVVAAHPFNQASKGMDGDIIALWSSHGRYFKNGSWQWQRPLLFGTLEDTYTMGYVLPFLVPMLENAGAYPILPRERDTNRNEVIVDYDTNPDGEIYSQSTVKFSNTTKKWEIGDGEGFIYDLPDFRDTENPFENGTYHQIQTIRNGKPSVAAWYADIPEDGEYAVYVSYKTLANSAPDARYSINYSGGTREFKVNQTMGGSTWIYLGTFPFKAGYSDTEPVVTLTNLSEKADKIVTADAIKIGGGMGNIARSSRRSDIFYDPSTPENPKVDENIKPESKTIKEESTETDEIDEDDDEIDDETDDEDEDSVQDEATDPEPPAPAAPVVKKGQAPRFTTSGLPRYLEGARYWLHWAGIPERVYSPFHGSDDYKDDYTSRGHWVNYLAGGSRVLPGRDGLSIPVDLSFALHSDAGKRGDDSFVGTLGIYYTGGGSSYADGTPRKNSRFFTDMMMRQITNDIRQLYEPNWTRRSMWDKSYLEARVAEVPTTLIELMSHQNFGDMQYGLDPNFRFDVARSMYKAMARFLGERKGREVVIQPLPVNSFAITQTKQNIFRLSWKPTPDPIEKTAMPTRYIIFERSADDLGFHKIGVTGSTHFDVKVTDNDIHSFKIVAANDGGMSFPSEILAFRQGKDGETPVMIVNGFTRVSGPGHFSDGGRAGFDTQNDFGVPYGKDLSFAGNQTEFRRSAGESFGRSNGNYINMVIPGNTFDFAFIHGSALAANDIGFVSCSAAAVEDGTVKLNGYKMVDLILGKQKTTIIGRGKAEKSSAKYINLPAKLQKALGAYAENGGALFVSGQYINEDMESAYTPAGTDDFAERYLGISYNESFNTSRSNRISVSQSLANTAKRGKEITFSSTLNEKQYIVERGEVLKTSPESSPIIMLEYSDNGQPAGLLSTLSKNKAAVMGFPFESITDASMRTALMGDITSFFKVKSKSHK